MEFTSQIVPAVVILAANLLSGKHGSHRYEAVTALFGWTFAATLPIVLVLAFFPSLQPARGYVYQVATFSILTALSRDYEKVLRPLLPWNR